MFDDQTINALLSLSRTLNFKFSARELNLSQPTLMGLIRKAKRDAELVIFERSGSMIALTKAGRNVVKLCRQQTISNDQFCKDVSRAASGIDRARSSNDPVAYWAGAKVGGRGYPKSSGIAGNFLFRLVLVVVFGIPNIAVLLVTICFVCAGLILAIDRQNRQ